MPSPNIFGALRNLNNFCELTYVSQNELTYVWGVSRLETNFHKMSADIGLVGLAVMVRACPPTPICHPPPRPHPLQRPHAVGSHERAFFDGLPVLGPVPGRARTAMLNYCMLSSSKETLPHRLDTARASA